MFHHDPQLTRNVGGTTPPGSIPACSVPSAAYTGYRLAATDGGVFSFGDTPFCGSTGDIELNDPVVGIASARSSGGYWEVAADGGIFAFGGAGFYGSMGGQHLDKPVVGMTSSTDGDGYRLVASDGGIFSFGDAQFLGSMGGQHLDKPVVGMVNDTNTGGYWEVASDGGVFSFGGAPFYGSTWAVRSMPRSWAWRRPPTAAATGWWPLMAACSASPRSSAQWADRCSPSRSWA
jgi:hypothetical protein